MVMPFIHHTLPTVVAIGATTRITEKAIGTRRAKTKKRPIAKKRVPVATTRRKVRKPALKRKTVTSHRKVSKSSLPSGKWVQLSREELVRLVGKVKADKVKASGSKAVKIGMYDKAIYVNGKYYLNIS